ncbi:MAG: hypothetical protein C4320_07430, partial [Armatimonadota bacterium]
MRVNLVANSHRPDALASANLAADLIRSRGGEVGVEAHLAAFVNAESIPPHQIADSNLVIALGGDGTLVRAAHLCAEHGTPILGVDFGRFGFVTQCPPADLPLRLSAFLDGELQVERRMMLEATLRREDTVLAR